jgi:hypothetical protein
LGSHPLYDTTWLDRTTRYPCPCFLVAKVPVTTRLLSNISEREGSLSSNRIAFGSYKLRPIMLFLSGQKFTEAKDINSGSNFMIMWLLLFHILVCVLELSYLYRECKVLYQ